MGLSFLSAKTNSFRNKYAVRNRRLCQIYNDITEIKQKDWRQRDGVDQMTTGMAYWD